jgi:mRNA interferase RelE/StbE
MKWQHSNRSRQDYLSAPAQIKKAFDKQVRLLAENLSHPSLRTKKYSEPLGLWQARVNRDWRFYFIGENDKFLIARIVPHPK